MTSSDGKCSACLNAACFYFVRLMREFVADRAKVMGGFRLLECSILSDFFKTNLDGKQYISLELVV